MHLLEDTVRSGRVEIHFFCLLLTQLALFKFLGLIFHLVKYKSIRHHRRHDRLPVVQLVRILEHNAEPIVEVKHERVDPLLFNLLFMRVPQVVHNDFNDLKEVNEGWRLVTLNLLLSSLEHIP